MRFGSDFKLIPLVVNKAKYQEIFNSIKRNNFEERTLMDLNEFMEFLACLGFEYFKRDRSMTVEKSIKYIFSILHKKA